MSEQSADPAGYLLHGSDGSVYFVPHAELVSYKVGGADAGQLPPHLSAAPAVAVAPNVNQISAFEVSVPAGSLGTAMGMPLSEGGQFRSGAQEV